MSAFVYLELISLAMKVENIREYNCVRALKKSRVELVCQHLFN